MHDFIKFLYGLLFISMCSAESIDPGSLNNKTVLVANTTAQVSKPSDSNVSVASEGGLLPSTKLDKTHLSREHVVATSVSLVETSTNTAYKKVDNVEEKPVNESLDSGISRKNDYTKVVPKKGAPVDNATSAIMSGSREENVIAVTNSTDQPKSTPTPVIKPKKPTITEHGDESVFRNEAKYNKTDAHTAETTNFHSVRKEKSNAADYVIPIVAVILSVPLVAIIISVLYKRGTYWWQHRNYRRMDFLIEGMYNT